MARFAYRLPTEEQRPRLRELAAYLGCRVCDLFPAPASFETSGRGRWSSLLAAMPQFDLLHVRQTALPGPDGYPELLNSIRHVLASAGERRRTGAVLRVSDERDVWADIEVTHDCEVHECWVHIASDPTRNEAIGAFLATMAASGHLPFTVEVTPQACHVVARTGFERSVMAPLPSYGRVRPVCVGVRLDDWEQIDVVRLVSFLVQAVGRSVVHRLMWTVEYTDITEDDSMEALDVGSLPYGAGEYQARGMASVENWDEVRDARRELGESAALRVQLACHQAGEHDLRDYLAVLRPEGCRLDVECLADLPDDELQALSRACGAGWEFYC